MIVYHVGKFSHLAPPPVVNQESDMKFTVQILKPRNPLIGLCRLRKAGTHGRSAAGQRQRDRLHLQRELHQERLKSP